MKEFTRKIVNAIDRQADRRQTEGQHHGRGSKESLDPSTGDRQHGGISEEKQSLCGRGGSLLGVGGGGSQQECSASPSDSQAAGRERSGEQGMAPPHTVSGHQSAC